MSEMAKTGTFIAVALVSLVAAWATRPSRAELDVQSLVGENLTKGFTDAGEAKRLRIVQFDESSATLREFEVAEENGLWTIPSKNGYPADAQRQMAEAATSLMDLKILSVASESAGDHEQLGVVDPLSPKLDVGQKGVGTHVTIANIHDEPLADLIIGREVKDAANEQHYVREAGRDVVYIVEMNTQRLSTDFEDWIEKDLLKLNPWDIQQVQIKDYSAELVPVMTNQGVAIQIAWDPRSEMTLAYDDTGSKWTPVTLRKFAGSTESHEEFTLVDDEELNSEKLNDLKNALDDLTIVDVARKPAGLSADLKAGGDFLNNSEARQDLRMRGFAAIPARSGDGYEIISSEGELICTMRNGVEYVLRFGDLRMAGDSGDKKKDAPVDEADPSATAKSGGKDVQRYLFAMARFNESAVKRPELAELPELPPGAEASDDAETEQPADDPTGDTDEPVEEEEEELETPESTAVEAEAEDASADSQADEDFAEAEEKVKSLDEIVAERKRIETENQRSLDQYVEQIDKGRETVKELNLRFGDWYFVVSNDVFQKVRLSRDDVIKKKDKADTADDNDASEAGAPGTAVPGLPSIPGADSIGSPQTGS